MSFCVLDCNRVEHYPLPAGHIASRLWQAALKNIEKTRFFDVDPFVSLFVAVGRKGDTFGCAGSWASLSTLFRSATIISINVWQNSQNQELAMHIHYFLVLSAKSYNDTT